MPEVEVFDRTNKAVSKIELPESIFDGKKKIALLHEAVVNHLANCRQGTAATKNRSRVRGGGAKPWRQKGTGRARAGTNTSPLWRGGGVIFGPNPRSYRYEMPRRQRRAALRAALAAKQADGELRVLDDISISEPKTKQVVALLRGLEVSGKATLIVAEKNEALELAARNIPYVQVLRVGHLGVYDIVNGGQLIVSADAVRKMEEVYQA